LHFAHIFLFFSKMTFLNPLVLFGLAAAAIPLVLHLLNLRKLRTIEFSSLRFLKELQKTSMHRVRVRQLMLLVLRMLLIACLVLAFSRPALRGSLAGVGGTDAASTMVIILDDSPSMAARDERGASFTRAQQSALTVAGLARDGDHLFLIPLSEARPGGPLPAPWRPSSAAAAITRMTPSFATVSFHGGLRRAGEILAASADANKEVVLITDGQASQFAGGKSEGDSVRAFDEGARVFLLASPPSLRDNAGILSATVTTRILSEKKPVRIATQTGNFAGTPLRGALASVYLDGSRVAQRGLDLAAQGVGDQEFDVTPKRRGIMEGFVEIQDDMFEPDNRRYFTLEVPDDISVLLVGPGSTATSFAALALAGDSTLAGNLTVRTITEAEFPSVDIDRQDVVILCGLRGLLPAPSRRIARFVNGGGGLIVFPGAESRIPLYNEGLFAELGLPGLTGGPSTQGPGNFLSFASVDYNHPLFEGMFDAGSGLRKKRPAVESPRIVTTLPLLAGDRGTTVIVMSDGRPFLEEYSAGAGRVLLFAVEAGVGWSDFPVKGLFAPLLHRAVRYLAGGMGPASTLVAGAPLELSVRLRDFTDRDIYTLTGPDGNAQRIVPRMQASTGLALFTSSAAEEPGVYVLRRERSGEQPSDRAIAAAAVNIATTESDLRPASDDELASFWKRSGITQDNVRRIAPGQEPAESIRLSRYGIELWKQFLMLAALVALAEMAVGRASRQRPGGSAA